MSQFKSKKIIIFESLNRFGLLIARLFKRLKYKVVYLQPAGSLNNEAAVDRLAAEGIEQVDYDRFRYYEVPWYYNKEIDLARKVYTALGHDEALAEFEPLFEGLNDWKPRLRAAAYDMIVKYLGRVPHACIAADYFARHYERVYLAVNTNAVTRMALAGRDGYRNLWPGWLSTMLTLGKLAGLASRFALKWITKPRIKHTQMKPGSVESIGSEFGASPDVLYFPHQGLSFGNLFTKDYYYSSDPASPFNPGNILHIELQPFGVGGGLPEEAMASYRRHNLKYTIEPKYSPGFLARGAMEYLRFICLNGVVGFFNSKTKIKHWVYGGVYALFFNYLNLTAQYGGAKIALVGYDALFPKTLSMALSTRGITTVAAQERFIMAFMPNFNYVLDQYLVWGPAVVDQLKKSDTSYLGTTIPIGPVRLDLIDQFRQQPPVDHIAKIKQNHHLIVAYDFPSGPDRMRRAMNPMVTWENNRAMYEDLIRLAEEIPNVYIILRGKDDVWCDLPEFKDIYDRIQAMPNMEINREYTEFHVSSRLAAVADTVVAKHTSIAEEALAAGIPVLFYDFMPNIRRYVSSLYDFEGHPVCVLSYKELRDRIVRIVERGDYMDNEEFKRLRQYLYASAFDGNVRARLQEALHGLVNQQDAEVQTTYQNRAAA
jgi:hypothetical protein